MLESMSCQHSIFGVRAARFLDKMQYETIMNSFDTAESLPKSVSVLEWGRRKLAASFCSMAINAIRFDNLRNHNSTYY